MMCNGYCIHIIYIIYTLYIYIHESLPIYVPVYTLVPSASQVRFTRANRNKKQGPSVGRGWEEWDRKSMEYTPL